MKGGNGSGERVMRSSSDKERTKLRERQRRSITTKIFNGLRQHGNYNLAPRSDINDVLRALAKEAGWVVEPDGTTYRSKPTKVHVASSTPLDSGPSSLQQCPTCIALRSYGGGVASSSHGGDSSTTASPRRASLQQPSSSSGEGAALGLASASWHLYQPKGWASASSGRNATRDGDAALALSFGSGGGGGGSAADCLLGGAHLGSMGYVVGAGGPHTVIPQQPFAFFEEARAPNYSTSIASPQRRYPGAL